MDTNHTAKVTEDSTIYGIDFGTGGALAIHGPAGAVSKRALRIPRKRPGEGARTPAEEFPAVLRALFAGSDEVPAGDVVVESATLGSSGCEPADVLAVLAAVPGRALYTISTRAVKNYRADHALGWKKGARYAKDGGPVPAVMTLEAQEEVHGEDAEIIYKIATETPARLYLWTGPSEACEREHTSVRPMDKRGYRDERAEAFMALLPPFESLPDELKGRLGDLKGHAYARSIVMPFAMASTEPHVDAGPLPERRRRYEKVIGLYDRGYPSFYRRATIVWMQMNAKELADVTKIEEVPVAVRKEAWKLTQRQIRLFFHLTMRHQGR